MDDQGGDRGSATSSYGTTPPKIISCSLYPDKPTAATQIIAHYKGSDADGDSIRYTFRWYVNGELVQEGSIGTLDPGKCKKGDIVYAEIIPSDRYTAGDPARTESVTIQNLPPVVESATLKPAAPPVGAVVTAVINGSDPDGDDVRYACQWFVNGKAVTERQDSNQFETAGLKKKDLIHAGVWPLDFESTGEPKPTDIIELVNRAPAITSVPIYDVKQGVYVYQITAADPDGDRLTYKLVSGPPGMTIDSQSGAVRWKVPDTITEKRDVAVKIMVEDGDGGSATQNFSLTLEMK